MNVIKSLVFWTICLTGFSTIAQDNNKFDITLEQAERLVALPLKCSEQEYPNKLQQVLNSKKELGEPSDLHPAFYGCFDWHSSVHGHWLMVALIKYFHFFFNILFAQMLF